MKRIVLLAALVLALSANSSSAQVAVYDAFSDLTSFTTTASDPHTFTGQAFSMSVAGGATPTIVGMRVAEFVLDAQNIPFSRLQVQFWGTFDPTATGMTQVFSNPIGVPIAFDTGAITTTQNAFFVRNLTFLTPLLFPGTTNLGIAFNWQSSADGVTFVDNRNLVTAMRLPVNTTPIPVGLNVTVSGQYYRNASNETNFNFNANSARSLGGTNANDGLAFQLTAVPEPTSMTLVGLTVAGYGVRRFRKKN